MPIIRQNAIAALIRNYLLNKSIYKFGNEKITRGGEEMKYIFSSKRLRYRLPIIVGASILFLGSGLALFKVAFTAPVPLHSDNLVKDRQEIISHKQSDPLPAEIVKAIRQILSEQTGIPSEKLKVIQASRETWSDGCLGLADSDEFCSLALVQGWRVVISDGTKNWVYRTDEQGYNIRLESQTKSQSND